MGLKATVTKVDATLNQFIVMGTIAPSGSYPATGHGDVLSFLATALGVGPVPFPATTQVPNEVRIFEAPPAGTSASGVQYSFSPGTTQALGKVQLFAATGTASGLTATATAPTITTTTNATTTSPIYVNGGALTETTGATGITGVQAPLITVTGSVTVANGEVGNVTYASLNIVNLSFIAFFPKFQ